MDIERVVAEQLMGSTGIKCVLEVPASRPDEFISVELTGGTGGDFTKTVLLAVQSWAKTRKRACEIASLVEDAAFDLITVDNIFTAEPNGTYRFPDPDSKSERYQTNVNLTICE